MYVSICVYTWVFSIISNLILSIGIMVKRFAIDARFVRTKSCLFELVILQ